MKRGNTRKQRSNNAIIMERKMVSQHDVLTWDLERCVGCQLGPKICPKDALSHVEGNVIDGRMATRLAVDVDPEACIFCGMCAAVCPVHAITRTLNGEPYNPVLAYEAFPVLAESITFDGDSLDWSLKDFVQENCPTNVISYDEQDETLLVDEKDCIYCRQCEVASDGAFNVSQAWEGTVILRRDKCVEGCLACADICPTRALYVNEDGELVLADYYCIKCGACVQLCPVEAVMEEVEVSLQSQGVEFPRSIQRVANMEDLPIWVERWRARHAPVQSGAWVSALARLADDKASMIELETKRAIKRRDLIVALKGDKELREREASRREALLQALQGSRGAAASE